jgi:hypothetical protein
MPYILARINRGERIDHYETVRRAKDGHLVNISLRSHQYGTARGELSGHPRSLAILPSKCVPAPRWPRSGSGCASR